jgi:hypothetical protein
MVEHHPQKDEIISSIIKKYMSLSFTVNGKVCEVIFLVWSCIIQIFFLFGSLLGISFSYSE